jgi:membrane associated rhomboid family serine protease
VGSLIGLAWGLLDGLIGGAIFAWLYNRLAAKRLS